MAATKKRYCPKCRKYVALHLWVKNKTKPSGFGSYCKECERAYKKRQRADIQLTFARAIELIGDAFRDWQDGLIDRPECEARIIRLFRLWKNARLD